MRSYLNSAADCDIHYKAARDGMDRLIAKLSHADAQHLCHREIEGLIQTDGMDLLRRLAQAHFDQRSAEEPIRDAMIGADGIRRPHRREQCPRLLETRFGEVIIKRRGYSGRGVNSLYPLDEALNLPSDKYSHGLREALAEEVTQGSFDEAIADLQRTGGGRMAKRQSEGVAVQLSFDFDAYYARPFDPVGKDQHKRELLVISADGKGIVMHPNGLREATRKASEQQSRKMQTRLSPGEKGHRKRMATVASVYEAGLFPRTLAQILDPEERAGSQRPEIRNKRTWASVERDQAEVIEQAFQEAMRRDPNQQKRWVVLIDGLDDLIRQVTACAERHQLDIVLIQDFVHVLEYIWKAAHALYPEEPEEREAWVQERAEAILEGRAQDVATGLRRAATRKQLRQKARQPVDKAAGYIEKNQERLRYAEALELGFPIATGVIEGACRHLVKDRMDITGARWGLECAEAILKLRSLKVSGDLESYLEYHFEQEMKRNYPDSSTPSLDVAA